MKLVDAEHIDWDFVWVSNYGVHLCKRRDFVHMPFACKLSDDTFRAFWKNPSSVQTQSVSNCLSTYSSIIFKG